MPEITAMTIALLLLVLCLGVVLGWILRGDRCAKEKIAVNAGWQQQMESQQSEHNRLAKQNKSLMEQVNQYQASIKDSTLRAKELSESLKETFQRRDELQRQFKDVRNELDLAVAQRDKFQDELRSKSARDAASEQAILQKEQKIQRLSNELADWQSRLPPLVDRYRTRDEEAREIESELGEVRSELLRSRTECEEAQNELERALARIASLENAIGSEHTRIEPVDADTLPKGLDASNEPHEDTLENEVTGLKDQIDDDSLPLSGWQPDDSSEGPLPATADDDDGPWARVTPSTNDEHLAGIAADAMDSLDSLETSANNALPPYLAGHDETSSGQTGESGTSDQDEAYDDLRLIKGVGPAIEQTLHELGFFHYRQIAEMTEFDIDRVARKLKGFRSRIYREDWIGQARMLQQQKSNSPA
ncbi:MAG: hypothetical protein OEV63_01720 [Gammaproteobacteria bacterium]|nr:hypothetical protein [Gammaproteobacteria bacterium]